ncbi:MAG: hypothetical protein ED559_06310 [Phycisphaera sp.]|nr:MAG: hypothetical protein ED559_06310 [Phycisphaera sp.]
MRCSSPLPAQQARSSSPGRSGSSKEENETPRSRITRFTETECLDHFACFSEDHLDYLIEEFLEHYHNDRPHQGIGNRTIEPGLLPPKEGMIVLKSRLGGSLKSYERHAA